MSESEMDLIGDNMTYGQRISTMQKLSSLPSRITDYILAISSMETGARWRVPNQTGLLNPACNRIPVGLEGRDGIRSAAWNNANVRDYLTTRGLVGTGFAGKSGSSRAWSSKILKDKPSGPVVTALFEEMIIYRFRELLPHFSLGPTQQLLLFTGLDMGGGNALPAWPKSWQELYQMYLQELPNTLLVKRSNKYLGPGPANDGDESVIVWLRTHQTGGKTNKTASDYYYGSGMWTGSPGVRGYLNQVHSIRMKG